MPDILILAGARTPIGRMGGALSAIPAHKLGQAAIVEALKRAGTGPEEVTDVIMGQVLTAGAGQNPARQAAMGAGIPREATAFGVNQICGSGMRATALGFQALRLGEADVVVTGGQENMSAAPHCALVRGGVRMGDTPFTDTLLRDGLIDAFQSYHMGQTAENIAERWSITRGDQDEIALRSQKRAAAAQAEGKFAEEMVPVLARDRKGNEALVSTDEDVRPNTTLEMLARLKPVFKLEGGTVTAGNSSGINDGAAALVLARADHPAAQRVEPLGRIVSWASAGVDPSIMGIGPVPATQRALARAGWRMEDVDLIEANEAFAVQSCAVGRDLGWDPEKVNVNGGAIALGHPIGASGARIVVTLLYEMRRRNVKRGLATLCIGGGMGIAMCVERG
ncbi:acetyl-CoA C-acetyltransferase [Verrucomicrobia bacterium LW23]|nr:acetyl-CoA C-acetyltransferase [Verrucomicrobia bacterium LW23]